MMKNYFYFNLLALFVLFFFRGFFGQAGKGLDKKTKFIFKIYDVIKWETNNYNTRIVQYLKKLRLSGRDQGHISAVGSHRSKMNQSSDQ